MNRLLRCNGRAIWRPVAILSAIVALSGCRAPVLAADDRTAALSLATRVVTLPDGTPGKTKIAFIAEVKFEDLLFTRVAPGYRAEVEYSISLRERDALAAAFLRDEQRTIEVASMAETRAADRFVRIVEETEVPPGEYVATFIATDGVAGSTARRIVPVRVPDFVRQFSLSTPLLMTDSCATLCIDKLVPLYRWHFSENVYALVAAGGLSGNGDVNLEWRLQDSAGNTLFTGEGPVPRRSRPYARISLLIPAAELAFGKNTFEVVVRQGGAAVHRTIVIQNYPGEAPLTAASVASVVEPMQYVMSAKAWERLQAAPAAERIDLVEAFWHARNPAGDAGENPLFTEFVMRVEEANRRFRWGEQAGWRSDRGRIFIIYGPPSRVSRKKGPRNTVYERWYYDDSGREFMFEDTHGDGLFRLTTDAYS